VESDVQLLVKLENTSLPFLAIDGPISSADPEVNCCGGFVTRQVCDEISTCHTLTLSPSIVPNKIRSSIH
jgi:hypothetical protein